MSKENLSLQDVRNGILQAIADGAVSMPDIEARLERESSSMTDFFESHNDAIEEISEREIDWNPRYFQAHLEVAKRGYFSEKRVKHLIEVRGYISSRNHKGFFSVSNKTVVDMDAARPESESRGVSEISAGKSVSSAHHVKGVGMNDSGNEKKDIPAHIAEAVRDPRLARAALEHLFYDSDLPDDDLGKIFSWAKGNVEGLLDEYEENVFSKGMNGDSAAWSWDYFLSQLGYLEANFCEERFVHLIAVRAYLRDVLKTPEFQRVVRGGVQGAASSHEGDGIRTGHEEKGILDTVFDIAEWGIGKFFDLIDYLKSKIR